MSSAKQDKSIDAQRVEVQALAARKGYVLTREFVDEGISGDEPEKRPAFLELRAAAERGEFQVVLCWDQDRLLRTDPLTSGYWLHPFRQSGVRLETCCQGLVSWDDYIGRLVYMLQQEGKHQYLRDLSRNIIRGKLAAAERGVWNGGRPPYGFTVESKRLAPNPDLVHIVRRIFEQYITDGMTMARIAEQLNADGIPPPMGKLWRGSIISGMLRNPAYIGQPESGHYRNSKYTRVAESGEIQSGSANGEKCIRKHTCPPIVSDDLFQQVQQLVIQRRRKAAAFRSRSRRSPMLSRLLRCGHCGAVCTGRFDSARDGKLQVYVCGGYHLRGMSACNRNAVAERLLLPCIVRKLREFWTVPKNLAKLRQAIRSEMGRPVGGSDAEAKRLRTTLADLNQRLERGQQRLLSVPDTVYQSLVTELDKAKREQAEVQAQLANLERRTTPLQLDADEMVRRAVEALNVLPDAIAKADPADAQRLLRGLVSRVELHFRQVPRPRGKEGKTRSVFDHGTIHLRPLGESEQNDIEEATASAPRVRSARARPHPDEADSGCILLEGNQRSNSRSRMLLPPLTLSPTLTRTS